MSKNVVVTLTDQAYAAKAQRTIIDVRTRGEWTGDIVLITVGFDMSKNWLDFYDIIPFRVEHIDTTKLLEQLYKNPIQSTCDNRQFAKLTQWDKFYVFHNYFRSWNRVAFFDAGHRVLDKVQHLFDLPCEGSLMAPDDAPAYDQTKRFGGIVEIGHITPEFFQEYSPEVLVSRYFLNCLWVYDTSLLDKISMSDLIDAMNKYPFCRCNEMTIMNLLFVFKHKVWKPFPEWCPNAPSKRLFGWTEHDRDYGNQTTWRDFCYIKYPLTLNFECI